MWNRQLQQARDEIQVVSVVAPNKMPVGNYDLYMLYEGVNYTSASIDVAALAGVGEEGITSMQGALQEMNPNLGEVSVTRTLTTDYEGGYQGYRYTVTFTGHPGDVPMIKLKSTNFTRMTDDSKVDVEVLREGVDNKFYNYKVDQNEADYVNELFLFWVMIFNSSVPHPEDLGTELTAWDLIKHACWYQEITHGGRVINLAPGGVEGQIVRVMLESDNYLSLAEVEVFESEVQTLSQYKGGSPVMERPITQPYVAEDGLDTAFRDIQFGGIWTLEIRDLVEYSNSRESGVFKESHGFGKIGDWVLTITDQIGEVSRSKERSEDLR